MKINIFGENIDITEAIKDKINSKAEHLKVPDTTSHLEIRLKAFKNTNKASAQLHFKGHDIHIEKNGDDMYILIDELLKALQRDIIKKKEKLGGHLS